jgi:RNA polymerase sigma-70 factor (ECF subfamily)
MTRDEDTADDVVQEVFVAAWRSAQTFRGDSSVRNWLLTITRNAARRTTRRRAGEPAKTEDLDQLAEAAGWGQGDMSPDFERALESRELLIAGMARLSADDGELVTLVDLEGLSLREAAGVLDLQLPTLKSRLHRARIRLIAALEEVSA